MASTIGLVLDSSVFIAAERRKLTALEAVENVRKTTGEVPVVMSSLIVAEIGHGIYRANTPELRERCRAILDELKATVPVHPVTGATAEIIARVGGEQAAKGLHIPLGDLIIGARAGIGIWSRHRQCPGLQPHPWLETHFSLDHRYTP
jgi:predicted nucleic acid-binding protein